MAKKIKEEQDKYQSFDKLMESCNFTVSDIENYVDKKKQVRKIKKKKT